jgi:hypothetical protein
MYTFYASMDSKKETSFDLEYLHSMLDLREFVRFGYHQKIVPDLISPEDMVYVYKVLLSESIQEANTNNDKKSIDNRTSGMIDYESFKKSLIRISVIA